MQEDTFSDARNLKKAKDAYNMSRANASYLNIIISLQAYILVVG